MGLLSPAVLDQVRHASDIVEIVGTYLPLKRAGANFVALCPFHKEKTPSFNVNPQRQIFHCFGCQKGGDVFTFVQEYEGVGFMDAVRRLAERASIPLEFDASPADSDARRTKDFLLQIHEQITQRWQAVLTTDAAGAGAREYLAKRGVPTAAIQLFRLGCAPDAWDDTVNWARSKGHDLALVEQSGLILKKEGTDRYYDRFRGRLIFPICDEQGRVIGFSGRVLQGDEKTAKYVNSPETPLFSKGRVCFGLDKTKRAILDAGTVVICEGQLDLIACYSAGVRNVVAPQGTAFTPEHARILRRYAEEVVLCFDSDTAGETAAIRSLDSLAAAGLAIRVATIPPPHDPDSYIKAEGADAFAKRIEQAQGFFDYLLDVLCRREDILSDRGRLAVLKTMGEAVNKTGNSVLVDTYAQKTALRLGVAADAVRTEFRKAGRSRPVSPVADDPAEAVEEVEASPPPHEAWLLKLLLLNDTLGPWAAGCMELEWIADRRVRQIVQRQLASHADGTWTGAAAFVSGLDEMLRPLVTEALAEEREIPNPERQLQDLILRLRNQHIDRTIAALGRRLGLPELQDDERLAILRQQQELRAGKQRPLAPP